MTPEDVSVVKQSWSELRRLRAPLVDGLARRFDGGGTDSRAAGARRAHWLFTVVEQLVELLPSPSRLGTHARVLGETWPDPLTAPSFAVEGRAWMGAACDCLASWSDRTDAAWRQAWLLLSEVLAAETLSPFRDDPAG